VSLARDVARVHEGDHHGRAEAALPWSEVERPPLVVTVEYLALLAVGT
jgi:hypothetical protein